MVGGGGGGGGGDSGAARCWSIDSAREIGVHGVRAGHTKDVKRQSLSHPLTDSIFAFLGHVLTDDAEA